MERQYKDSGIEWIGGIPKDWKMQPLVIYFAENSKPNSDLYSIKALQFKYGEIIQKPNNGKELTDKDRELLEKYTIVAPDDIVVNGLNLNYDLKSLRIAKVREEGIITSAYIVLRPRNGANASYYNYYLKALDFQKIFHGMGVGIRLTLSYNELRSMLIPVPAVQEQQRIADYLDKKCGEIDSLIELQERMIAQLTEYKQSVITEAVTKGLDPNAPLVSSGIDWIGDIPKGWKIGRIKNVAILYGRIGFRGYTSEDLNKDGEGAITLSPSNMLPMGMDYSNVTYLSWAKYYESPEIMIRNNDLLMVKTGSSYGKVSYVNNLPKEATINPQILRIIPKIFSKYLGYFMQSPIFLDQVEGGVVGGTIPTIAQEKINNFKIILPPESEQQAIATYLDKKCGEIDDLIAMKQKKIETLKEYKKSVIYEAVTGKTLIDEAGA